MAEIFVPLTSFGMFKSFFKHEKYLKMFLEDILNIKIKKVEYQDSLLEKEFEDNKECRLEATILLNDNSYNFISMEMHNEKDEDIISKSHYYLNKIIMESFNKGKSYKQIKKFIAINILNYNDERFKKLYHICKICDEETKEVVSDLEEIHIISLKSKEMNEKIKEK